MTDVEDTGWTGMILGMLRSAELAIEADSLTVEGYRLRGDALLLVSHVLRLRYPDDPTMSRECLEVAEQAFRMAEDRARHEGGLPLLEVQCALAQILLYNARLYNDEAVASQVYVQLRGPLQALEAAVGAGGARFARVLADAYMIRSALHAGQILGYPTEARIGHARHDLRLAADVVLTHSEGGGPPPALIRVWTARALLEAHVCDRVRLEKYAGGAIKLASESNADVPLAICQALLQGGPAALDQLMLDRYAELPDRIYVGL